MLLGAQGCQQCECKPCIECTAECDTTPPDNFDVVYQANDTDGALQWTGDAMGPIDGPYPGFEGAGPFSQTISLASGFGLTMPGDRFPCYFRVKFWRNVGGGEGSEAVTSSVTIICSSGKVNIGPVVLSEGESVYFGPYPEGSNETYRFLSPNAIPLVSGGDDQSLSPPLTEYAGIAECSSSSVILSARIEWTNELIQHNLYGTFVECYDDLPPEDPGDCLDCDGTPTPAPETVYLTISNFDGGGAKDYNADDVDWDGTYAIPLIECVQYSGPLSLAVSIPGSPPLTLYFGGTAATPNPAGGLWVLLNAFRSDFGSGGGAQLVRLAVNLKPEWSGDASELLAALCGDTPFTGIVSGAAWQESWHPFNMTTYTASFDWELSW